MVSERSNSLVSQQMLTYVGEDRHRCGVEKAIGFSKMRHGDRTGPRNQAGNENTYFKPNKYTQL